MIQGTGKSGAATEQIQTVNSPLNAGGEGGLLTQQKDAKESATTAKFGDYLKDIQSKYGEKPEKPREIKKSLGKDDFLRIMISQMKNQDPTNPFKAEQMATEIAQFTSVEQLQNVNQNINKMAAQNKPLEQMAMTNLIGKIVTIDRERFPHTEGENEQLTFNLPRDAKTLQVHIFNEAGESVYEKDMGSQKTGAVNILWDGIRENGLPSKSGNYIYRVTAKDDREQNIDISPKSQGKVIGVTFEGNEPVFLVGDAQRQDKVTMKNIARIEVDQGQLPAGPPTPLKPLQNNSGSNFMPFQRGTTQPLVSNNAGAALPVSPPINPAVSVSNLPTSPGPSAIEEKGFPNGLH